MEKDILSTACQVMEDWVTPKGAGRTSSTWLWLRWGATVLNQVGKRTAWVVKGRLVAR